MLDPRIHAHRPDLADQTLDGQVTAARYAKGEPKQITAHRAPMRAEPSEQATQTSEALFGEQVLVFEEKDGWAWIQSTQDRYVGYAQTNTLGPATEQKPTHRITAPRALIFSEPSLKAPIQGWLPMAAQLTISETSGAYALIEGKGWTHQKWLAETTKTFPDYVATAKKFMGAPYGWGGKTMAGLDCSALVQLALTMAGIPCQRDSDQQAKTVGQPLEDDAPFQKGDLMFFPGHVGLMMDSQTLLHANATNMAVTADPLGQVEANVRKDDKQGRGITARRRITRDR